MNNYCSICKSSNIKKLNSPSAHLCKSCNHLELSKSNKSLTDYSSKINRNFNTKIEKIKIIKRAKLIKDNGWSGGSVLELGCAEGRFAAFLLKQKIKRPAYLVGIEPSKDANLAKEHFDLICSDLNELPNQKFDLIYSFHVLEHIRSLSKVLKLIKTLLNTNGKIVIEIPNRAGSKFAVRDFNPEHIHSFSVSSISILLEKHNFYIEFIKTGAYESPVYDDSLLIVCKNKKPPKDLLLDAAKKLGLVGTPLVIAGLGNDYKKFIEPILDKLEVFGIYDKNVKNKNIIKSMYKHIKISELKNFQGIIFIASFSSELEIKNDIISALKKNNLSKIITLQELLEVSLC